MNCVSSERNDGMKPCPECGELVPYRMVKTGWHYQVAGISYWLGALHSESCRQSEARSESEDGS